MAGRRRQEVTEDQVVGFKYFKKLAPILDRLHDDACARDRAHNRQLHFDQYSALILLYMFNPIITSLRGIVQASELKKVQSKLGCARASLGSLSEAARVFDSDLLLGIIGELSAQVRPLEHGRSLHEVQGILTLVDGTLLAALPKLTEAMWLDENNKAFKLHTHFELLKGVPVHMDLTDANACEWEQLAQKLLADRVYVTDRGYAVFVLFQKIIDIGSSFVCRVRDNSVYELIEQRPLSSEALDAGLVSDEVVWLGSAGKRDELQQPLRLVRLKSVPHRKRTGKRGRGGPEQGETILIATDLLDVPAEVIALIFKNRWAIETFFRFFKHVLGCRHLLSHHANGIEIQTYMAIIACLLIALWTGKKPTLRTYEMICFYFTGLADEQELLAHIAKLKNQAS